MRGLIYITGADFVVRTAYQMGKTPLLPVFALSLGATDVLLGLIVSVSTVTGMVLKPFVGVLSDRWGRRSWLLVGTAFFAGMPFAYQFVDTPEQLFTVRLLHGTATAIYGPVTLAYVVEQAKARRSQHLGWFGLARIGGYVVGPLAGGVLLGYLSPVAIFTIIGLLSSTAFVPVLLLPSAAVITRERAPLLTQASVALRSAARAPGVWITGCIESTMNGVLYASKTFLPIHALGIGVDIRMVGVFFAVQEGAHFALNPVGGYLGDRYGRSASVVAGLVGLASALLLMSVMANGAALLVPAALMGASQALVFPALLGLASTQVAADGVATGMGLIGALRNAGKVAGPVGAGALIAWLDFETAFLLISVALASGLAAGCAGLYLVRRRGAGRSAKSRTPDGMGPSRVG